jgi:hypothetical protein
MSEWVVQAPAAKAEPVPVGFYLSTFKGVEDFKMQDGALKWRFVWEITKGEHVGKLATALTDRKLSLTALPGVLIAGLLGRTLATGENVKAAVEGCVGKVYMVGVQPGPKNGKPGVRSVGPPPAM